MGVFCVWAQILLLFLLRGTRHVSTQGLGSTCCRALSLLSFLIIANLLLPSLSSHPVPVPSPANGAPAPQKNC